MSNNRALVLRLWKIIEIGLISGAFALCWYLYYAKHIISPFFNKGNWVIICLYIVLFYVFAKVYEAFQISMHERLEIVIGQMLSFLLADGVIYIIISLLAKRFVNLLPGIACIFVQFIIAFVWATIVTAWYKKSYDPHEVFVIYENEEELKKLLKEKHFHDNFLMGDCCSINDCAAAMGRLNRYKIVFYLGDNDEKRNDIIQYCIEQNITIFVSPSVPDLIFRGATNIRWLYYPIFRVARYDPSAEYVFAKRALDIIFSALLLLLLSPLMMIVSIVIKAEDHGPIFYRQTRLTIGGKHFKIIKFRSMCVDAEKDGKARLSTGENDDRITRVGKAIRRLRIDELPQLINILLGDMSFVGPRPERPEIAEIYEKDFPEFKLRLQAKAGLTGYAQIYGKYNSTPQDKLKMDLMYIANPGIVHDISLAFATLRVLFQPESTEGIEEGKYTA